MQGRRVLGLLCLALCLGLPEPAQAQPRASLVVLLVVDQLGAHYLRRWGHLTTKGIGAIAGRGAYYRRGTFAYANTETAAGHATVATGAWPNVHGLVANRWYDASGRRVYCVEDPNYGRSPANLMAPGIADAIKMATHGRGKTFSFSIKDRAAIALGGTLPDLVAWYDVDAGHMVAGKWDGTRPPPAWFNEIVLRRAASKTFGKRWVKLRKDVDYAKESGPDELVTERLIPGLGRTFPRVLGDGLDGPTDAKWRKAWRGTPATIDTLMDLALTAVAKEKLGRRGTIDYLALSISTLDIAGHWWGSHANETLDILLRIDAAIGRLVRKLEARIGAGNVIVAITADHGSMPTPEEATAIGVRSRRIPPGPIIQAANRVLEKEAPKEGLTVLDLNPPRIYLSPTRPGVDRTRVARAVADAVAKLPGVVDAVALADLGRWPEPLRTRYRRSTFAGRNPDVLLLHRAHEMIDAVEPAGHGIGTGHGSPYGYDTTVPVIVYGPGVRGGVWERPVPMTRVAPTIAALLEIEPPAAATDEPLSAAFR